MPIEIPDPLFQVGLNWQQSQIDHERSIFVVEVSVGGVVLATYRYHNNYNAWKEHQGLGTKFIHQGHEHDYAVDVEDAEANATAAFGRDLKEVLEWFASSSFRGP